MNKAEHYGRGRDVVWICPKCSTRLSSDHRDTLSAMTKYHKDNTCKKK